MYNEEPIPTIATGMRQVTKDEFYAAMNCNVHPTPTGKYNDRTGYVTEWLMNYTRKLIGVSDGTQTWGNQRYWLPEQKTEGKSNEQA